MFQVGDLIIYSGEGVCRVESIGKPEMSDVNKDRLYYTLAPIYREGKIFIPVDTKVFMRPILTKEAALELIRQIPQIETTICQDRNQRQLTEHYQNLIQSHQCDDLVQIIKAVYLKEQVVRARGKKPGQVDERYRKRAEDMLHGELAVALGIDREEVASYIQKSIEQI